MKRRKAIKQLGLGLSAGVLLPTWLSACKDDEVKPEIDYDGVVGIIGAGAAGLYVADILAAKGIQVKIFEASDRAGGRVKTLKSIDKPTPALIVNQATPLSSDFPSELGAEHILGSNSEWAKMVTQLRAPTVAYSETATDNFFLDNLFVDGATAATDDDVVQAKNFLDNLAMYAGGNVSVQAAIQAAGLNARTYEILTAWLGNKYGTSNDRLSMLALAESASLRTRDNAMFTLSTNPMQDALLSRFAKVIPKVQLGTVIQNINYTNDIITLSGEKSSGQFSEEVNKVIVTVPVSILKSGGITFTPSLSSAKLTALSNMEMDAMMRVILDFKANFWGEGSGFLYGGAQGPEYFNAGVGRSILTKTLSVTIGGAKAEALSPLGKDAVTVLIDELDSIFDGKASLNIRRDALDNMIAVVQDWSKEPFIAGGVSYIKPGGTNQDRVNLGTPVGNRLFFAGEATDVEGEAGTISGALLSAERAAQEVINTIVE